MASSPYCYGSTLHPAPEAHTGFGLRDTHHSWSFENRPYSEDNSPLLEIISERFGLGYVPRRSDLKKRWCNRAHTRGAEERPKVILVSEEEKVPYQGQPEPYFDVETKNEYPGFEIFIEDTWDSEDEAEKKEELVRTLHTDWVEAFDQDSLRSMFGDENPDGTDEDTTMMMLGDEDACEDPSTLIVDATGRYENCVFIPLVKHAHAAESESESDTDTASS
ncbi:hypothetical protein RHMOL_Rhmol11G0065500 [Rhododendron molle]|uniref:Uncharacterized protein n=1 Tax=Rhododendron molle TaxID=49168 RepID=A0ACC0LQU6_RHOML|nr:hypothetical protein RHMOL_Rhmol11G0065500 [Rhododendron molle]